MYVLLIGVPRLLRTDCGTENTHLSFMQPFLRQNHTDALSGMNSFRYGKSISNQVRYSVNANNYLLCTYIIIKRIEAWWSTLKKWCTLWWYNFFMVYVVYVCMCNKG